MISSLLCWWGIHTGKWAAPYDSKSWQTTTSGVVTVKHVKKQERYCAECNVWQIKEVETGEEVYQPWSASYKEKVAALK